jgi:hypothetical protein
VLLDSTTEAKLAELGLSNWQRHDAVKQHPLRCIAKELIVADPSTPAFRYEMLPQIRKDLQELHARGIIVWNLRSDNFMNGKVVDLSQAKTVPHLELSWDDNPMSRDWAIDSCAGDYNGFDAMIYEWNDAHPEQVYWDVFLPNPEFGWRLRNGARYKGRLNDQEGVRLDALFYDWKKQQPWAVRIVTGSARSRPKKDIDDIIIIKKRGKRSQKTSARRKRARYGVAHRICICSGYTDRIR